MFGLRFILVFELLLSWGITARAESGVTDTQIRIGTSLNLSAYGSERAIAIKRGSDLVFKKINASGGIHGRKIEVIPLDDSFSPQRAYQNMKKLIQEEQVFVLFQCFGTANTMSSLPAVTTANIPFLFPSAGALSIYRPTRKQVFAIRLSYFEEMGPVVDYLLNKGMKDFAIVYQDDASGQDARDGTLLRLSKHNLKPKVIASFRPNVEEVKKAYDEIAKAQPQVVVLGTTFKSAADFAKLTKANKQTWILAGPTPLASSSFLKEGGYLANGAIVSSSLPWIDKPLALTKKFKAELKTLGKNEAVEIEGYINALVFVEGLRRAGKNLTREKLVEALESLRDFDLGGLKITFGADRHFGVSSVFLSEIRKGEFHSLGEFAIPPK